jgi:hypothetical protein
MTGSRAQPGALLSAAAGQPEQQRRNVKVVAHSEAALEATRSL